MEWRGGKTAFLTGPFYYYALLLFALLGLAMWRITQSPFGLHLRAIRENAGKAAYVGVEIFRMRLAAFVISAVYGGIGGTILAITTGLADPELAYWTHSGNLVFMEVIGADGAHIGTVDKVEGGRIKLTKKDSGEGSHKGHHHFISKGLVAGVEGNKVRLSANADVAVTMEEEK